MVAFTQGNEVDRADGSADAFSAMLRQIRRQAAVAFRGLGTEAREEATHEVIANAFLAYQRLVRQGRADLAYATPLAMYAIKQYRVGRRVGSRMNKKDVLSTYGRAARGIRIRSLDGDRELSEMILEDKKAGPAETAAARIDVAAWFSRLPVRLRRIALALAKGETTRDVAKSFQFSAARISQLRQWLRQNWETFTAVPAC